MCIRIVLSYNVMKRVTIMTYIIHKTIIIKKNACSILIQNMVLHGIAPHAHCFKIRNIVKKKVQGNVLKEYIMNRK